MSVNLFVYGTLMRKAGHPMHDVVARHGNYMGEASIKGTLYSLGAYPGLVLGGESLVHGELYALSDPKAALPLLDTYEGCAPDSPQPHAYIRRLAKVRLESGEVVETHLYEWIKAVDGLPHFADGRFVAA